MKGKIILAILVALLAFVLLSCLISQMSWTNKENTPDSLRQLVGLPTIAIGNLNPAVRNPGLELLCTGLYDAPGGYCSYFTDGVPFINFIAAHNFTVSDNK
jgi:hypothetical protein